MVEPAADYKYNTTFYIVHSKDMVIQGEAPLPLVKNSIINEISTVRDNVPIKFGKEILVDRNSTNPIVYGLVYDKPLDIHTSDQEKLRVSLEAVGVIENGTMKELPNWLDIKTIQMPILLEEDIPNYYGIIVSISPTALQGTYQIAFRETIQDKLFIETMTVTVE